ncbi:hypothetical protein GCK72_003845 [Caenorhabditis remanei]|uniref:F-box associated domain-containing protein n=1 Tax=Caenorhabditis remanei TaxID=31234 RepID=A0A6A5HA29_CAERE|nr:hypothetical protein GCK72_003845 [Caenorhabditis remanei]KAF1763899.1 hypothetical protein GCK72_003845 [Caenorhabditis remanei]
MDEQRENHGGFPLQKLPWLVTAQIIRSMETWEQIRLCLTSNKMELITRSVRLTPVHYECHFTETGQLFVIDFSPLFVTYGYINYPPEKPQDTHIMKEELSKWMGPTDESDFEKIMRVFERVISIIPPNFISVGLYPNHMTITTLQNVFSHPSIRNCDKIFIDAQGTTTNSEFLDYVLNTASRLKHLKLGNTNPPYGYHHEKMFQIGKFEWMSSEWISIESLFTIKNYYTGTIEKNQFSYADLNRLLKYWIHSEIDMWKNLFIQMEEEIPEDVLFDGIVRLKSNYFTTILYFIKSDLKQRKRGLPILTICCVENKLRLSTWSPDESWRSPDGWIDSFQKEYEALRTVERRRELERRVVTRYGNVKLKIRELNEQLEQLQEKFNFTIAE